MNVQSPARPRSRLSRILYRLVSERGCAQDLWLFWTSYFVFLPSLIILAKRHMWAEMQSCWENGLRSCWSGLAAEASKQRMNDCECARSHLKSEQEALDVCNRDEGASCLCAREASLFRELLVCSAWNRAGLCCAGVTGSFSCLVFLASYCIHASGDIAEGESVCQGIPQPHPPRLQSEPLQPKGMHSCAQASCIVWGKRQA